MGSDRYLGHEPLANMALEEIRAYTAARDHALGVLQASPAQCRPSGWFGTVSYTI